MGSKDQPDAMIGADLDGYRLQRRLGKGGMGEVYLAHDTSLDRSVAVKLLLASHAESEIIFRRFQREARAAARLSHPNIVQIHAVGQFKGRPYFVMEYVDGIPLDALLRRQGALDWQRALSICGQVASALERAHAAGIVHRDIKPANILLDKQGRVRVSDFGIAKVEESNTQLTSDGMFIGTPQYMSPEQCGVGEVGPASDVFSLGATVYEMLTGQAPFRANTPAALIRKITLEDAPPLANVAPDLPQGVCDIVDKMLERLPEARYASASELLADLHRLRASTTPAQGGTTIAGLSASNSRSGTRPHINAAWRARFTPKNIAIVGLVATVTVLLLVVAAKNRGRARAEDEVRAEAGALLGPEPDGRPPAADGKPPAPGSPRRADPLQAFKRFDLNGDARLSPTEFPEKLRNRFRDFDANADGAVDETEFREGLRRLRRMAQPPSR